MVVPDLFARVTLMDRASRIITHLGDDSQSDYMQTTRKLSLYQLQTRQFVVRMVPVSITPDIYVVEWVEKRMSK